MQYDIKILLVEDNPGDAFLVKFYLEESIFKSAQFIHAEYLQSAIDILSKNKIDVVLLDLNLPDSKGLDTVKEILEKSPDSVVIVLTGLADNELGVKTVKLGAQDFLVKGQFDGKVLTSSIRYAFERAQLKSQVKALDGSHGRFTLVQELTEAGYWELNSNTREMYLSDTLKAFLELDKDAQYELMSFQKLFSAEDAEKLNAAFETAIENNGDLEIELPYKKGGKTIQLLFKGKFNAEDKSLYGIISSNSF